MEKAAADAPVVAKVAPPGNPPPLPAPLLPPPPETPPGHFIELQIGDFLERIPSAVLKPGQIDRALSLRFDLHAIAGQFKRSDPRIPVLEIYKRQPSLFCRELVESSEATVLLPWQKIIEMVLAREGTPNPLPPEILAALTQSLREPRPTAENASSSASLMATPATQGQIRPPADSSTRSWFSPKPMPSGALTTLPSTLRPPPTAGEALSLARSSVKPAATPVAPATGKPFTSMMDHVAPPEFERAALTKPAPSPARPASEVLGEQLASITSHFSRLVRQLEETTQAQVPARAQHIPGLEHLIHAADQKLSAANQEREAVVSLKAHLDSQFEALTFAQSGVATLQETLEAQSREFGRMQQVLTNVEEQLANVTGERDALAAENAQLTEQISTLRAGQPVTPPAAESQQETQDQTRITAARACLRPIATATLAHRSAARAAAHREGSPPTVYRPAKPQLIHRAACKEGANGYQPAHKEAPFASGKKDRRHKRR